MDGTSYRDRAAWLRRLAAAIVAGMPDPRPALIAEAERLEAMAATPAASPEVTT